MIPAYIGAMVNSALYLAGVLLVGLMFVLDVTIDLAVASIGLTYLCYVVQLSPSFQRAGPAAVWAAKIIWGLSVMVGFLAGVALLMRI